MNIAGWDYQVRTIYCYSAFTILFSEVIVIIQLPSIFPVVCESSTHSHKGLKVSNISEIALGQLLIYYWQFSVWLDR